MTNYQHWCNYTDPLPSPQKFIDWSFYYLISSALQRRVWCGNDENPLFPNIFIAFVAEPGVGKGLPIKCVNDFLKHWKMGDNKDLMGAKLGTEHKLASETIIEQDLEKANNVELQTSGKGSDMIKPLLFPVGPDAITYESLIQSVCESYRRINYPKFSEKLQKEVMGVYGHSSIAFNLPELTSLLRKNTESLVTYLLGVYDCPDDYEYKTKHQGKDRVRRACLNLLGAIQPDILQNTFNDNLINSGLSSRIFFIYSATNRKHVFDFEPLTSDQILSKAKILEHIKKLSVLYGRVNWSKETQQFLREYWHDIEEHKEKRSNKSSLLRSYYSRKNVHIQKLAISKHFSESTEMFIDKSTFDWAIKFLDEEEKTMHLALNLTTDNPIAKISKRVKQFLSTGEKNWVELLIETNGIANQAELTEAVDYLREIGQIKVEMKKDEHTDKNVTYYKNI